MTISKIAIIGACGKTGRYACDHAVGRGLSVVAIDKDVPDANDRIDGVVYRKADVLGGDLASELAGCDAVISTLGLPFTPGNAIDPPPLYTKGTQNILDAMKTHDIRRIAVISAAFVVHQPVLPDWFRLSVVPALHAILDQMREMERLVQTRRETQWTIARPGWLLEKPAKGGLLIDDEHLPEGAFRCRDGDLGCFLVDVIVEGTHIWKKPALGAPEAEEDEGPRALGKALLDMLPSLTG